MERSYWRITKAISLPNINAFLIWEVGSTVNRKLMFALCENNYVCYVPQHNLNNVRQILTLRMAPTLLNNLLHLSIKPNSGKICLVSYQLTIINVSYRTWYVTQSTTERFIFKNTNKITYKHLIYLYITKL